MEEKKLIKGFLMNDKVYVEDSEQITVLLDRGYGEKVEEKVELLPWEALHLTAEGLLEVFDEESRQKFDMEKLLNHFSKTDESVWSKYLVYRDLRGRGYVVKPGFGEEAVFRVYERGTYGKEAAKLLVYTILEGEPLPVKNLINILNAAGSLKKQVIVGVIERHGEIIYYSLSRFSM